jgi:hypothetical protein
MSDDVVKVRGTTGAFKSNSGGDVDVQYPVKGVVKDTIDSSKTGRIRVYISDFGSLNPDDAQGWTTVSLLSPFFGVTKGDTESKDSYGKFTQNPHSYGMWMQPPDIDTEVVCVFLNGKKDFGYYIGCIPQPGLTYMVPAVGASDNILGNDTESAGYGGAERLPVTEYNANKTSNENSSDFAAEARPVHSVVAGQMFQQGLLRDKVRGSISSSSMRESPSRVFGFSTPGRPIYKGGFTGTDPEIAAKVLDAKDSDLKVVGRRGGHSVVLDDGDFYGETNQIRIRSASGHQITMSDDGQTLFIIHANGQSYIEMGKEGTVDIFSMNSFNVRTQGDINFHADNNINLHAKKQLNMYAEQLTVNTEKDMNVRVGTEYNQHTVGDHAVKSDKRMSLASKGDASLASGSTAYINGGPTVNLNTGSISLKPKDIKPMPQTAHPDSLFDKAKGWIPAPALLTSLTSRAPAHTPWINANLGVDVKVDSNAGAVLPDSPSASVAATNASAPTPAVTATPSTTATVPVSQPVSDKMDKTTTSAVVSQSAAQVAGDPKKQAAIANTGAGVVTDLDGTKQAVLGKLGHSPEQLDMGGYIKPGASAVVNGMVSKGTEVEKAFPGTLWTGKDNIYSVSDYVNNPKAQVNNEVSLMQNGVAALTQQGVITGNESGTQIAGLAMSAAKYGATDTAKAVQTNVNASTAIPGIQGGNGTLSTALNGTTNLMNNTNVTPNATIPGLQGGAAAALSGAKSGNVAAAIGAGNYASGMSDKLLSPAGKVAGSALPGTASLADSVKGAAAGAFGAIKNTFKALKPNTPQNLTTIAAEQKAAATQASSALPGDNTLASQNAAGSAIGAGYAKAAAAGSAAPKPTPNLATTLNAVGTAGTVLAQVTGVPNPVSDIALAVTLTGGIVSGISNLKSAANNSVTGSTTAGMGAFAGGAGAINNIVDNTKTSSPLASTSKLAAGAKLALNDISAKTNLTAAAQGLSSVPNVGMDQLASAGLDKSALAQLNSAVGSLNSGGPNTVKLPTVATNTVNRTDLNAQAQSLLGPGVPMPLTSGSLNLKSPPPELAKKYDELKKELAIKEDVKWDLSKAAYKAKKAYGPDSADAKEAEAQYNQCIARMKEIREEMSAVTKQMLA